MRIDLGAENRSVFQDRLDVPQVGRNLRLSEVPSAMTAKCVHGIHQLRNGGLLRIIVIRSVRGHDGRSCRKSREAEFRNRMLVAVHHGPERNLRKNAGKALSFHNVYSEALLDACLLRSVAKPIQMSALRERLPVLRTNSNGLFIH